MKKFDLMDIILVVCFVFAVFNIDLDKEVVKGFVTGAVFTWLVAKRVYRKKE